MRRQHSRHSYRSGAGVVDCASLLVATAILARTMARERQLAVVSRPCTWSLAAVRQRTRSAELPTTASARQPTFPSQALATAARTLSTHLRDAQRARALRSNGRCHQRWIGSGCRGRGRCGRCTTGSRGDQHRVVHELVLLQKLHRHHHNNSRWCVSHAANGWRELGGGSTSQSFSSCSRKRSRVLPMPNVRLTSQSLSGSMSTLSTFSLSLSLSLSFSFLSFLLLRSAVDPCHNEPSATQAVSGKRINE